MGKVNFTNLSRYSALSERTDRRQFEQQVEFASLNRARVEQLTDPTHQLLAVMEYSFIAKSTIRLAYLLNRSNLKKPRFIVLFSTDVEQDPTEIYKLYTLRFQIEFLFRDAKQFTGLADCPARDCVKLEFHFNASFTALHLVKVQALQPHQDGRPLRFSMASVKRRALNEHLLDRFICNLNPLPTLIKSHPNSEKLRHYGMIAA